MNEDVTYIYIYNMYMHTHNGLLLNHKNEKNVAICSNIGRLGGYYAITMK